MSDPLEELLDLEMAWKRFKLDHPHRVFVEHPFENSLIELDLDEWLQQLREDVASGHYRPGPIAVCDVPKSKGAVRPGAFITAADAVVYAACVGACFSHIHYALQWSQNSVDFSYLLPESPSDIRWIRSEFRGWSNFQQQTLDHISNGATHVVFADITGYYENIDLAVLMSDVRQTGAPAAAIQQLSTCLNKWAEVPSRGIPQGYAPSDILGKLYLNSIDEHLVQLGCRHIRYVDDFRVFCGSEVEAKKAQLDLTRLLRKRGLCLQTAKTEILLSAEARQRVEMVRSTLLEIREKYFAQIEAAIEMGDPYLLEQFSMEILNDDLSDDTNAPMEAIREAYSTYLLPQPFVASDESAHKNRFDKTLFHFLINRLGKAKDPFAVEHCISLLAEHPEETRAVCEYLHRVEQLAATDDDVVAFLNSEAAIYHYQVYELLHWRLKDSTPPNPALLRYARRIVFDGNVPAYLRATARKFLGDFGSNIDLERLEYSYAEKHGAIEQVEIICSLQRMEKQRRNSFVGRCELDSMLHKRAAAFVKQSNK